MFADLPEALKTLVKEHLLANEFQTAKAIHDKWMKQQQRSSKNHAELQHQSS